MSEILRVFFADTELLFSDAKITTSNDYIIDKAKIVVASDVVSVGSSVQFRKEDGETVVFDGVVVNKKKDIGIELELLGKGNILSGIYIQNVWEDIAPEDIVREVILNYVPSLDYVGTYTSGYTITRYIADAYAIDVVKDMLDLLKWELIISHDGKVEIRPFGIVDNGVIFSEGYFQFKDWSEDNNNLANKIRVVGGFESFSREETIGGTNNEFVLSRKPRGTLKASINGAEVSPDNYEVKPEERKVIFNNTVTNPMFFYEYSKPVVAEDENTRSKDRYGEIFKKVSAPWLTKPKEARKYAKSLIDVYSEPLRNVVAVRGGLHYDVVVGESVRVIDTFRGEDDTFVVKEIIWDARGITEYHLGQDIKKFSEWQREIQERIKKLERRFTNEDEIIFTRRDTKNLNIVLQHTTVPKAASPTNSFWLGHKTLNRLRHEHNGSIYNFEPDCSNNDNNGYWHGSDIDGAQYFRFIGDGVFNYTFPFTFNQKLRDGFRLSGGVFNGTDNYLEIKTIL